MFTDGVNEAMNKNREEFGTKRLDNILTDCTDKDCQKVIDAVKTGIHDFVEDAEQSDDITMLVLKRK
jgi:sigma-B regulation protein RsbU (phosphoserine phosphatase)